MGNKKVYRRIQMHISGLEMEVLHKEVKNMNLRVYPAEEKVQISVPRGIPDKLVRQYLEERVPWIQNHIAQFRKRPSPQRWQFISGEKHWVWGKECALKVIEKNKPQKMFVDGDTLWMQVRPGSTLTKRALLLKEWYRAELKKSIPEFIERWETPMEVSVQEFGVKLMKTRWGTCNIRAQRIWLNLELAKKRPELLEYVVVHEMVHLLERLHNKRFYDFMTLYLPHWKKLRNELNGKESITKVC